MLAQNEINSIDLSKEDTETKEIISIKSSSENTQNINEDDNIIKFDIKEQKPAEIKIEQTNEKEIYQNENQIKLDNIFNTNEQNTTNDIISIKSNNGTNIQNLFSATNETNTEIKENLNKQEIKNEEEAESISLEEIQINLEENKDENNQTPQEKLQAETIFYQDTIEPQQTEKQSIQEIQIEQKPIQLLPPESASVQDAQKQPELVIDFNLYISGFNTNEIIDQFLICAYYIKHTLRNENFTMKFLNSKLFPATGKIADMSVVEALISKNYIKTIETEESIKYTITPDGEEYFNNKFQSNS